MNLIGSIQGLREAKVLFGVVFQKSIRIRAGILERQGEEQTPSRKKESGLGIRK
jgi:hypothetical protein